MIRSTNSRCRISSRSAGPMRSACRSRLLDAQVAPGHDVVQHAHALEQRQVLEGAGDAHLRHLPALHVREGLAAEGDAALLRLVDAVDAVEHRALAGAVGADDGAHLVLAHVERDVGEGLHAAEGERDVAHVQDHLADAPARPGGSGETAGSVRRPRWRATFGRGASKASPAWRRGSCGSPHGRIGAGVHDLQRGADHARAPILEFHLGLDVLLVACRRTARPPAPGTSRR